MATPTADSYTASAGTTLVRGGRGTPPVSGPSWWVGKPLGQWFPIPGTTGPGAGLNVNAFSDLTIRTSDSTLFAVASGGHADGSSNAAAAITLGVDSPAWTTLRESSTPTADVLYYADGRPTSRHTYHHTHYIASRDAVLLAGCRFGWGGGTPTGPGMDLFDLATNDYSPRYTFPDITPWAAAGYGVVLDGAGNLWTQNGYKFTVATSTWSKPGSGSLLRYPAAYDSIRDKIFALQVHDGEGFGTAGVQAKQLDPANGNSTTITFNSSAALTTFTSAAPEYAGMAYCPLNGKFYFANQNNLNRLFVITPNAGTAWDMETLAVGGATLTSPATLCKRIFWVPALSGFVLQYSHLQPLQFMRMA